MCSLCICFIVCIYYLYLLFVFVVCICCLYLLFVLVVCICCLYLFYVFILCICFIYLAYGWPLDLLLSLASGEKYYPRRHLTPIVLVLLCDNTTKIAVFDVFVSNFRSDKISDFVALLTTHLLLGHLVVFFGLFSPP